MQPIEQTIAEIRAWHRQRCFFMEQRKRQYLALGAFLRMQLGWSRSLPDKERNAIAKRAQEMVANGEGEWCDVIGAVVTATQPFEAKEAEALKELTKLAERLPVWLSFGKDVRGFGAGSLAVIVAEAGDLGNYVSVAKLWKRLGLAVMGDVRQGGLSKGASKDAWIEHGYSPKRRSRMWNIGDALIKGNRDGRYRTFYLARKEYEVARNPEISKIHAHRRAQRYMEKRLLKDLWWAWRQATILVPDKRPRRDLPAADHSQEARA
jgi:hypothetical protein